MQTKLMSIQTVCTKFVEFILVRGMISGHCAFNIRSSAARLECWIFQTNHRGSRNHVVLRNLWATFQMLLAASLLLRCRKCRHMRLVGICLPQLVSDLFWDHHGLNIRGGPQLLRKAAVMFIDLQQTAQRLTQGTGLAATYCWFGFPMAYIGSAVLVRARSAGSSGLVFRWMEHQTARHKVHHPEHQRPRYKIASRAPLASLAFIVTHIGPTDMIRSYESTCIASLRPRANDGRVHAFLQQSPTQCVQRRRRRKLRSARGTPGLLSVPTAVPIPALRAGTTISSPQWVPSATDPMPVQLREAWWWSQSFSEAYNITQLLQRPAHGPIYIYQPSYWFLMILWIAAKPYLFQWTKCSTSWNMPSSHIAIVMNDVSRWLKGPVFRQRLRAAISRRLQAEGLPGCRRQPVVVPGEQLRSDAASFLQCAIKLAIKHDPARALEYRWIRRQVIVVAGSHPTHLSQAASASTARQMKWNTVLDMSPEQLTDSISMSGAKLVPRRWDVEMRRPPQQLMRDARQPVFTALAQFPAASTVIDCAAMNSPPLHSRVLNLLRKWRQTDHLYHQHTENMEEHAHTVITPDDKHTKYCWQIPSQAFAVSCLAYIVNNPMWALSPLSIKSANKATFEILRQRVPKRLHGVFGIRFTPRWLPCLFISVKSKCFDTSGSGRVCQKPAHSCCRKIVSFSQWPSHRRWKSLARAWETILKSTIPGFEVFRLKDAADTLRRDFTRVQAHALCSGCLPSQCQRCFRDKDPWCGIVADAGQFFESVTASDIEADARKIINRALAQSHPGTVSVRFAKNRIAWKDGRTQNRNKTIATYTLEEMLDALVAATSIQWVRVGSGVAQIRGLMIGSFVSKIACSIRLSLAEADWADTAAARVSAGFASFTSWRDLVVAVRSVDDLLMTSAVFCSSCLGTALQAWSPVAFDTVSRARDLPWLDCIVCLPSAWSGDLRVVFAPKHLTTPPAWDCSPNALRSFLIGRCMRMHELQIGWDQAVTLTIEMYQSLRSCGWQIRHFRWCMHTIRSRTQFLPFAVLFQLLKCVCSHPAHDQTAAIPFADHVGME